MEAVVRRKALALSGGMILERVLPIGRGLDAGRVAYRMVAMDSPGAVHSLLRVQGRDSRKFARSYFCLKSINRWCTNAMFARLNARGQLQKSAGVSIESTGAHEVRQGRHGLLPACGYRRDLDATGCVLTH